jgi:transcriptional regulator with XRE-family HTH domain
MAHIGRKLRTKRLERDVTQAQLAKALDTEQSMVAMVEAGTAEPGDDLLGRMNRWISSGTTSTKAKRGPYKK